MFKPCLEQLIVLFVSFHLILFSVWYFTISLSSSSDFSGPATSESKVVFPWEWGFCASYTEVLTSSRVLSPIPLCCPFLTLLGVCQASLLTSAWQPLPQAFILKLRGFCFLAHSLFSSFCSFPACSIVLTVFNCFYSFIVTLMGSRGGRERSFGFLCLTSVLIKHFF